VILADIIRGAFKLAHQRAGLILMDLSWKFVWAIFTVITIYVAAAWMTSDLFAIGWEDTGRNLNALIALALVREFWARTKGEILSLVFLVSSFSIITWVLAEAFMRRIVVRRVHTAAGEGDARAGSYPIAVFLASSVFRSAVLTLSVVVLLLVFEAGAQVIAIVSLFGLAFAITLVDSLVRADAVELLGTDLFRAGGLVGILMIVELMIGASIVVPLLAGFLNIARLRDAAVIGGGAAAAAVLLSLLHSYLLVVRFSAIAIMRRNVVEI
jgi:hypothetical protein